ncbi:MAG: glycosyltransferase family 39 protein [Candidatus Omnitrophica bacterium]|nr:glycosyltransferase family 39 protein [Candidatus Omnitrophota bacterium]
MKPDSFRVFKKYKEKFLIFLIICFALGIRFYLLINTVDFHGISAGKIMAAELILRNKLQNGAWFFPVHPPAHLLMLIVGLKIFNNPAVTPRLISLFFGTITLLPLLYYTKEFFGRAVALLTLAAAALYSEHIIYSVIATSEASYLFFVFLGLLIFSHFGKQNSHKLICFSAVLFSLASLCRYEGMIFIPILAFVLLLKRKMAQVFLFLGISLVFPFVWMMINFSFGGNPLLFLTTNNITVPLQFEWIRSQGLIIDSVFKILFWPKVLIDSLGCPVFSFGIIGVLWCIVKKEKIFPAIIFVFLFLLFIIGTFREQLYLQSRYSIILGLMLIPFSIFAFLKLIQRIFQKIPKWIGLCLVWSMIPPIGTQVLNAPLYAPYFARQTAKYLQKNVNPEDNIIMDHCGDEKYREPIKVLSAFNPAQFILRPYLVVKDNRWVADKGKFFEVLEVEKISVLVYSPMGDLGPVLELEKKGSLVEISGFCFKLLDKEMPYMIYRVEKKRFVI